MPTEIPELVLSKLGFQMGKLGCLGTVLCWDY